MLSPAFHLPPPQLVDVGHSRLAYRRFGEGPDLVFVHGWPLSSATFRNVVKHLQDRFTCHLLDLPGAGHTASEGAPTGLRGHARTVLDALERLGLSRYGLVGHDSGGSIARFVAASAPDRVTGLVLSGTEIPHHHSLLLRAFVAAAPLPAWLWRALVSTRWLRRSRLMLGAAFADRACLEGEFHDLLVAPLIASTDAMRRQLAFLRAFDLAEVDSLTEAHAAIRAPTLLVWGTDDVLFDIEAARRMAGTLCQGRLVAIEGGRTFVHEEFAERFAELAAEHFARSQAAPGSRTFTAGC